MSDSRPHFRHIMVWQRDVASRYLCRTLWVYTLALCRHRHCHEHAHDYWPHVIDVTARPISVFLVCILFHYFCAGFVFLATTLKNGCKDNTFLLLSRHFHDFMSLHISHYCHIFPCLSCPLCQNVRMVVSIVGIKNRGLRCLAHHLYIVQRTRFAELQKS